MAINPAEVSVIKVSGLPGAPTLDGAYFHMVIPNGGNYAVPENYYARSAKVYTKSETYSKTEVESLINAVPRLQTVDVVATGTTTITDPVLENKHVVALLVLDSVKTMGFTKTYDSDVLYFDDGTLIDEGEDIKVLYANTN